MLNIRLFCCKTRLPTSSVFTFWFCSLKVKRSLHLNVIKTPTTFNQPNLPPGANHQCVDSILRFPLYKSLTYLFAYLLGQAVRIYLLAPAASGLLEGRLLGKKGRGRPKAMLLSWLLEISDEDMEYSQLKELAQERTRWCRWRT